MQVYYEKIFGDIQKVRSLKIPPPLHPCSSLFVFEHPHPPSPPPPRKEINDEYQYLWLNSTCLLRSRSGISIKWTSLVHNKSVGFMASEKDCMPFIDKTEYYNLS